MKKIIALKKSNRLVIFIVSFTLFAMSCISSFEPHYKGESNMLVVEGSIIKGLEKQEINISRASSISNPVRTPEINCQVKVVDDSGNEFVFSEVSQGKYVATIDDALLTYNNQYKLVFSTPSGENYESGYQTILKTAPVDSIYTVAENHLDPGTNQDILGLQFYADLNAPDDAPKFYKWQIDETWEVHAGYKIGGIYDGKTVSLALIASDSLYYCWATKIANGFYTSSTVDLSHNIIKKIPLHFKLSTSQDLLIKYCATVKQFALNKDAYDYWHQKEMELKGTGQLYTTQPNQFRSNISNTGNPDEKVLGFFWASSCSIKRLFLKDPFFKFVQEEGVTCKTLTLSATVAGKALEDALLSLILRSRNVPKPPLYIYSICGMNGCIYFVALTDFCLDCRTNLASGTGTTKRPDFWQ
ncbi:MAG TPA: DUF4249 domain-containing protein [Bacteroidales bacterium]